MMLMNNILRRTVSSVLALAVTLSSVQLSGLTGSTAFAAATGVKGDANSDGVVTEADLAIYESYFFNGDDISDDVIEDMNISYTGEAGYYAYISKNDYLAVKKYLAGETASVEVYDKYTSNETYGPYALYTGHEGSLDFRLSVDNTPCDDYEIVWNGEAPSGLDITTEGYLAGTPSADDAGKTFDVMVIGKIDGEYAGAYQKSFTVYAPSFEITTEDGSFTYGDYIEITEPGTYNIASTDPASQVEATETILISENVDGGKVTLCLNGMNINYGDAYYPGDFIVGYNEQCDIDIVLSGSNVIRNAGVSLFTQGQVNLYGSDADTLSLLGNSFLGAEYLTINGGDITVKNNSSCALSAYQFTMLGGSLDASFAPVEGATDNTSYTSLTGVGMECGIVTIRRGNLKLSGNEGAINADSIEGIYVSPLFCDIDISVSDDGITYSAIEGSPFSDPVNSPSAYTYTDAVEAGAPDNSIDIFDHIADKNFVEIILGVTYSYKVTINTDDHGKVTYEDDTSDQKTLWVSGGEKLPEGITLTADEGWEIDSVTASINGGSAVNVTDISDVVISGDTVINVTTKDVKAPVISGITDGSNYCGTITFTVTDDSDVSVTINGEVAQPDANGVYTIVGNTSAYGIRATDAFGNETEYTITVYESHPSVSNHQDNGDGTHTGVCDYCHEDVVEEHNFRDWESISYTTHRNVCDDCGYIKTENHTMGDWESNDGETHSRVCSICHYLEESGHNFGEWSDYYNTDTHVRVCEDCRYIDEAEHNFGEWEESADADKHERICLGCGRVEEEAHNYLDMWDYEDMDMHSKMCVICGNKTYADHSMTEWIADDGLTHSRICQDHCGYRDVSHHTFSEWTENAETGKHERECEVCGHTEEAEHSYGDWTDNHDTGKCERICETCGHTEDAEHIFGEWTDNHDTGKCERICESCNHIDEAEHIFGEWTDNHDTGKCERICESCGHTEEMEHIFGEWTDNHDTGKHEKICENCSHTEEADHTFGEWIKNQETGKLEKECADCGHTEIADHAYGDWTDNAETGKHERTCEICGETEEADHKMSEWTAVGGGEHIRKCTDCGRQEAENHSAEYKEHNEHFHERLCTVCGDVAYGEHLYDAVYEGNEKHRILCTLCGYNVTVESCKGVWAEIKPATCTEEGEEAMICDVCGEEHTRVIEMLPHEFINGRCSSCYMEDPTIGESSTNPPTGVTLGTGLAALIPASALVFFARPKTKKRSK